MSTPVWVALPTEEFIPDGQYFVKLSREDEIIYGGWIERVVGRWVVEDEEIEVVSFLKEDATIYTSVDEAAEGFAQTVLSDYPDDEIVRRTPTDIRSYCVNGFFGGYSLGVYDGVKSVKEANKKLWESLHRIERICLKDEDDTAADFTRIYDIIQELQKSKNAKEK